MSGPSLRVFSRPGEGATGKAVLIIGMTDPGETLVASYLAQSGCRVVSVADVVAAREQLNSQEFGLAYLQVSIAGSLTDELKEAFGQLGPMPIVLVCSGSGDSLVLEALRAGAADVIFLPLTTQSLEISLQRLAKQNYLRQQDNPTRAQARFRYIDESGSECWAEILAPKFLIGRSSVNNLILSHMNVSRLHAEILTQSGEYLLRDTGSKQGTYLNGARVEQAKLIHGDRVQLGGPQGITLVFHEGDLLQSLLGISDSKSEINLSVHGFKEIGMMLAAFRALSSIPLLDDLLALVVDTAIELTAAERGFIMLREENDKLKFRCARDNRKQSMDGSSFRTSQRVPYDVFKTGHSVAIRDLDVGVELVDHNATRQLGLRSISCVPLHYRALHDSESLIARTEIIGVLYVDSSNVAAAMSNAQLDDLETLASEAAMAIYNARLYKDSEEKRRMDEQLVIAREIQQALLPQPVKELPFVSAHSQNLSCFQIGGDYLDYFTLEGNRFGFAIGDVAGKGIPAALLASMVQGMFSTQALIDAPAATVMSNVNRTLVRRGTGNRFVTFFFGILDPDGTCIYVNAGHNPPFLISRDGSMRELTAGGMVLGLFGGAEYEMETIQLKPDDHLVLFTDGVTEALNPAGEEFGKDRLETLLQKNARAKASEILALLQKEVLSFSAQAPQHDDITMMVLGFRESQAQRSAY